MSPQEGQPEGLTQAPGRPLPLRLASLFLNPRLLAGGVVVAGIGLSWPQASFQVSLNPDPCGEGPLQASGAQPLPRTKCGGHCTCWFPRCSPGRGNTARAHSESTQREHTAQGLPASARRGLRAQPGAPRGCGSWRGENQTHKGSSEPWARPPSSETRQLGSKHRRPYSVQGSTLSAPEVSLTCALPLCCPTPRSGQ